MGWESKGGRRYYARKFWLDGRCVTRHVGGGAVGEAAARDDARRRVERAEAVAARRAEADRLAADERALAAWCAEVEELAHAALLAAGYRQHARGQWRRSRERRDPG